MAERDIEQLYGEQLYPNSRSTSTRHRTIVREQMYGEQVFDSEGERPYDTDMAEKQISARQREILEFIAAQLRDRGCAPWTAR